MTHAPPSWIRYLVVWLALCALTVLSWLLSLAHLGSTDIAVALVIAVAKTSLVLLFFMHLAEARFSIVMIPVAAVFFVATMVFGEGVIFEAAFVAIAGTALALCFASRPTTPAMSAVAPAATAPVRRVT